MSKLNFIKGANRINTSCEKWDMIQDEYHKKDLLPFWVADSDYRTCKRITKDLCKRAKQGTFGYSFINDNYREVVCNWMKTRHNYEIQKEYITITHGIVSALFFLVRLVTNEGDNVVVSTPVYNPFYRVIEKNNRNIIRNELIEVNDGNEFTYKIDFEDLEKKLSTAKLFILCNPHNPIGRVWTEDELAKIFELCKKYNVFLISDEIHCDLILGNNKFYSMGKYIEEYDKMAICTAASKTFNIAGLSNSNIIIKNKEYREKFQEMLHNCSMHEPNIFGMEACRSAYLHCSKWVDEQNEYLYENYKIVRDYFLSFNRGFRVCKLQGTYLMWIDLSKLGLTQEKLFNELIEAGVVINNGTVYSPKCIGYIRLNIACGRKQLKEGLRRIGTVISKF